LTCVDAIIGKRKPACAGGAVAESFPARSATAPPTAGTDVKQRDPQGVLRTMSIPHQQPVDHGHTGRILRLDAALTN
jgi:hypothetical protein